MSNQAIFEEGPGPAINGFRMDTFHVANFCRACLTTDYSLIETTSVDHDSIKFSDKLRACVAEVMWLKEGLPSLICSNCIDSLRLAYEFRNVCLQSDQTFTRYISQMQSEIKSETPQVESTGLLEEEAKIVISDTLPCIKEEPPNSPEMHFVDVNDCLEKSEHFIEMGEFRHCTPKLEKCDNFIGQKQLEPVIHIIDGQYNTEKSDSIEVNKMIQLDQQEQQLTYPQIELELQKELQVQQQPSRQKQVIRSAVDVQEWPPSSENVALDDVQPKSYTCSECSKTYQSSRSLSFHMRTHTGQNSFECEYCRKRFYNSANLDLHIKRHKGEKPFQCAVCDKHFVAKFELKQHMKNHTGEKSLACTICDQRCLTPSSLKLHMRTHTGERPYICATCGRRFARPTALNSHLKTHTGVSPFTCKICEKSFRFSTQLSRHMRKHTGEKVSCKICDAKFTHPYQLTIHIREHTGKQPYRCTVCDKVFNYSSHLKRHVLKHEGEKFTCLICEKQFASATYLMEHQRIHTGERPHICGTCGKKFARATHLNSHINIHTGVRPFTCKICEKSFTYSTQLSRHMRKHTEKSS